MIYFSPLFKNIQVRHPRCGKHRGSSYKSLLFLDFYKALLRWIPGPSRPEDDERTIGTHH